MPRPHPLLPLGIAFLLLSGYAPVNSYKQLLDDLKTSVTRTKLRFL